MFAQRPSCLPRLPAACAAALLHATGYEPCCTQQAGCAVQGYLAHKKQASSIGPPKGPRHRPTLRAWGGTIPYEVPLQCIPRVAFGANFTDRVQFGTSATRVQTRVVQPTPEPASSGTRGAQSRRSFPLLPKITEVSLGFELWFGITLNHLNIFRGGVY